MSENLQGIEKIGEGMPGGFFIYRAGGNEELLYANSVVASIFGCDSVEEFREFVGNSFRGIVYPDDYILTNHSIDSQVENSGANFDHVTYRIKRKDGQIRWLNDYGRLVSLEGYGDVFYVFVADETEQHEEMASNHNDKQVVAAMDDIHEALGSGDWSMKFDGQGQMISCSWSQRFRQMVGYKDLQDFPDKLESWSDLLHPEDKERVLNHYWDVVRDYTGNKTYNIYYRLNTKHLGERWFRAIGRLTRREDGSPITFYGIFLDVDDQLRREQEEKASNQNLILALTSIYNNVFVVNMNSGMTHAVRNSAQIDGMDYLDADHPYAIHEYMELCVVPEDRVLFEDIESIEGCRKLFCDRDSYSLQYRIKRDGEIHYIQAILVKPSAEREEFLIAFSNADEMVEHERQIQQALQEAYDAAKIANNAKSDFLQTMSHDIRTPMNGIIGMTAIAAAHIDDKERVQDSLHKITSASRHLLSLINEVLDMSKIESGKVSLTEEEFNLSELTDNMIAMVRPQMLAHKHELTVNIQSVEHELVIGDSLRVQQVFINLMSNAIKYTPDGGHITFGIREIPSKETKTGCYEFTFKDDGIGMSEEFLAHIFEPFARAEDGRINKIQGTGLGMPIAKNIVNMMGGDIEVESQINEGTTFIVTIHLKLQDTEETEQADFSDLQVLVADDDSMSMESAVSILEELGMKADGVLSGQEAVDAVAIHHKGSDDYNAVILDWKMPGMDGVETARAIRQEVGESVPIIILSAYDWADIETEARAAGVNAFISKPLFKSKLRHLFYEIVEKPGDIANEVSPLLEFERMDLTGYRCLLAEDNELNAEIAIEILKETGLSVEWAKDGAEAVEMVKDSGEGWYDIILMDIQMPKMNGYDATRAIRATGSAYCSHVPIIAMTANAFAEDVQAAQTAGMSEHMAKPIDLRTFAKIINKYLK